MKGYDVRSKVKNVAPLQDWAPKRDARVRDASPYACGNVNMCNVCCRVIGCVVVESLVVMCVEVTIFFSLGIGLTKICLRS